MSLSVEVAATVRRLAEERGWSGREVSRRSGIPQPSISRKLAGVHPFDLDDVEALCAVLEITVPQLVEWAQRLEQLEAARDRLAAGLAAFRDLDAAAGGVGDRA